jgi:hypothetical protein
MFAIVDSEESLIWTTSRWSRVNGGFWVWPKMSFDYWRARCQKRSSVKARAVAMG